MTQHKTKKMKRSDRTKFYRDKAQIVLELTPSKNALWMAGTIIEQLYKCQVKIEQIKNIESKFIHELLRWDSYEKFLQIAWAFGNIVQSASGAKIYIDILK